MNESQLIDEMVKFLADGIKVFGDMDYCKRCIPMLKEQYGEAVARKIEMRVATNLPSDRN